LVCGSLPLGCGVFVVFALFAMKYVSLGPKEKGQKRPYRNVFNKMMYRPRVQAFAWNSLTDPHWVLSFPLSFLETKIITFRHWTVDR
jgi:hypothetical protein